MRGRLLLGGGFGSTSGAKWSNESKKGGVRGRRVLLRRNSPWASLQCEGMDAVSVIGKLEGHCSLRSWLLVVLGVCPPPGSVIQSVIYKQSRAA